MINFRFHLVSLIAVFLAVGIGIAMGASFMDVATVDAIHGQLDRLEDNYRERGIKIDEWKAQSRQGDKALDTLFLDDPRLLTGRLADRRIVLVAAADAPARTVDAVWSILLAADAEQAGDIRIRADSVLVDRDESARLRELLSPLRATSPDLPTAVIDELGWALAVLSYDQSKIVPPDPVGDTAKDPEGTDPDPTPGQDSDGKDGQRSDPPTAGTDDQSGVEPSSVDGSEPSTDEQTTGDGETGVPDDRDAAPTESDLQHAREVVDGLVRLRAISLDTHGSDPTTPFPDVPGVSYVLIGTDGQEGFVSDVLGQLAGAVSTRSTNVITVIDGGAPRALGVLANDEEEAAESIIDPLREDPEISARLSTVDGIEELPARVAVVLALEEQSEGRTGHYGRRSGAQSLFPASPPR